MPYALGQVNVDKQLSLCLNSKLQLPGAVNPGL